MWLQVINKNAFQWDAYHPPVDHIPEGGLPARGVPALEGCTWWGVYWHRVPGGLPVQVLPPANRMIDRCKNITLPKTSFVGSNKVKVTHQGQSKNIFFPSNYLQNFTYFNINPLYVAISH